MSAGDIVENISASGIIAALASRSHLLSYKQMNITLTP